MGHVYLATQHPVRIGAVKGIPQYFRGRVTCLQIYGMALNPSQIATIKKKCAARDRKYFVAATAAVVVGVVGVVVVLVVTVVVVVVVVVAIVEVTCSSSDSSCSTCNYNVRKKVIS